MKDEFSIKFPKFLRNERIEIKKALENACTEKDIKYLLGTRKLTYLLSLAFLTWTEGKTSMFTKIIQKLLRSVRKLTYLLSFTSLKRTEGGT